MVHKSDQQHFLIWSIFIVGASVVVLLVALLITPDQEHPTDTLPQLVAGQIVESNGEHRSPSGKRTLVISDDDTGNIHIAVHVQSSAVWCIPFTNIPYRTEPWDYVELRVVVESERDWFASVDQYDRLWVYYSRWDKQWGELRELPSGNTRPYAPAVVMHGLSFHGSGGLSVGGQVVDETGDWIGVPAGFLKRVQSAAESDDESKMLVPLNAPTFNSQQVLEITRRHKHAS